VVNLLGLGAPLFAEIASAVLDMRRPDCSTCKHENKKCGDCNNYNKYEGKS
jgi:hypothetical protein